MRKPRILVLSLVERGWQGPRECSLDVQRHGIGVLHLIKGRVSRPVLQLIEPRPSIRLLSVARPLFWPCVGLMVPWLLAIGRLRAILVDNDRSFRRLRGWTAWARLTVTLVQPGEAGYELRRGAEPLSRAAWLELVGADARGADL